MNIADLTKGFDMSSIMADQVSKNYVRCYQSLSEVIEDLEVELHSPSILLNLSSVAYFEPLVQVGQFDVEFILCHFSDPSFEAYIFPDDLVGTNFVFLKSLFEECD